MQLFIDKDSGQWINDPAFKAPIDFVSFKRGDAANVEIKFVRGNAVEALESGAAISFGIKPFGEFDADFLVFSNEFTSLTSSYIFAPSFNTAALDAALFVDENPANDVASLPTMLEVSWSEASGVWQSSRTIRANIENDVIRGDEFTPVSLPSPEDWLADQFTYLEAVASPLVTLTSDEEETVVTLNVPAGTWDIQGMATINFALGTVEEYSAEMLPAPTAWDRFGAVETLVDYDGTRRGLTQLKRVVLTEETEFSMVAYCYFTDGDVYGGGKITARKVPA